MACLRDALTQTLQHGYAHHIQRLMVTGLYTLLLGVRPQEVHAWYLAVYVDAVEWVELPNTLGMSQYGDGGLMASKPYVATGKYIQRMGGPCAGCRYDPAQREGERRLPVHDAVLGLPDAPRDAAAEQPAHGAAGEERGAPERRTTRRRAAARSRRAPRRGGWRWHGCPMTTAPPFAPTRAAALARIAAVRPADYARSRNALDGAVTQLSPYITHGLVTLPQVLAGVASRHRLGVQHKFVFELGWREFFRHAWAHRGDAILQSLHAGPLPEAAYARVLPADIRQARTGVPAIDCAVRTLYATGMLHNHARMWLASYVVHLRKVHWRAGADWLYAHLLDGDLASNHLSWQWVAGTGSHKPYLFNAENVARYAPLPWHSDGSVIDRSYSALDTLARSTQAVPCTAEGTDLGVEEPATSSLPPSAWGPATVLTDAAATAAALAGREVWLVHPWALGEPPRELPAGCLRLGLLLSDFHDAWPWSAARWAFVGARMAELSSLCWHGSWQALAQPLAGARSVHMLDEPHLARQGPAAVTRWPASRLFGDVARPCTSFSRWWARVTDGIDSVHRLPGLVALARDGSAGPLFDPPETKAAKAPDR